MHQLLQRLHPLALLPLSLDMLQPLLLPLLLLWLLLLQQ